VLLPNGPAHVFNAIWARRAMDVDPIQLSRLGDRSSPLLVTIGDGTFTSVKPPLTTTSHWKLQRTSSVDVDVVLRKDTH
jgi:hypothetical protein